MRRAHRLLALTAGVCLFLATACDAPGDPGGAREGAEEPDEEGLAGLALLHRGLGGGDPAEDQALVFHDPDTGEALRVIALPDGAVDPMAPDLPVHAQFSEDWQYFAYATTDPEAIHLAVLTEHGEDPDEEGGASLRYEHTTTLNPSPGERLRRPLIHGDRLWFASESAEPGGPAQVMSVDVADPGGAPRQEDVLPLDENNRPSDWAVTPEGALHVRTKVQTRQIPGEDGTVLIVRETGGNIVNASLAAGGHHWQSSAAAPVWGGGTALLAPADQGAGIPDGQAGAYLAVVDEAGQRHRGTPLPTPGSGPVLQYAPAPGRDALLLQTEDAWYRVPIGEDGPGEAEEAFPRFYDSSLGGYPLAVRWSRAAPQEEDGAQEEDADGPAPG